MGIRKKTKFLNKCGPIHWSLLKGIKVSNIEHLVEVEKHERLRKLMRDLHVQAYRKQSPGWFLILKKKKGHMLVMALNFYLFGLNFTARKRLSENVNWVSISHKTELSKKKRKRLRKKGKVLDWQIRNNFVAFACLLERFLEIIDKKSIRKDS